MVDEPSMKSSATYRLCLMAILLYHVYAATADVDSTTSSVEELESCDTLVSRFPKDNTDLDGNVFQLKLSTVECKCAGKFVRCVYTAEGTSKDSGAINYTSDKCVATNCSSTVEEEGRVCQQQEGWKQNDSFDVSKFNLDLFTSWCVPEQPPSDATSDATMLRLRSALFGLGKVLALLSDLII